MDPIEAALESLRLSDTKNITATARQFNVNRSTLSRRHNLKSNPALVSQQNLQLLSPE